MVARVKLLKPLEAPECSTTAKDDYFLAKWLQRVVALLMFAVTLLQAHIDASEVTALPASDMDHEALAHFEILSSLQSEMQFCRCQIAAPWRPTKERCSSSTHLRQLARHSHPVKNPAHHSVDASTVAPLEQERPLEGYKLVYKDKRKEDGEKV